MGYMDEVRIYWGLGLWSYRLRVYIYISIPKLSEPTTVNTKTSTRTMIPSTVQA